MLQSTPEVRGELVGVAVMLRSGDRLTFGDRARSWIAQPSGGVDITDGSGKILAMVAPGEWISVMEIEGQRFEGLCARCLRYQ